MYMNILVLHEYAHEYIVCMHTGTWAGVVVEGASTRGTNKLGEVLTLLRAQLREPAPLTLISEPEFGNPKP